MASSHDFVYYAFAYPYKTRRVDAALATCVANEECPIVGFVFDRNRRQYVVHANAEKNVHGDRWYTTAFIQNSVALALGTSVTVFLTKQPSTQGD